MTGEQTIVDVYSCLPCAENEGEPCEGGACTVRRSAVWTLPHDEGLACPLCSHDAAEHDGGCSAETGEYDHLNGFHVCGCPALPPA